MKVLQAILAFILVYPTCAKAQQPRPDEIHYPSVAELKSNSLAIGRIVAEYSKTHTQAQADAEFRSNAIARVERQVAEYSKAKSPYTKFEDGKVAYLGKKLYEREGILELSDITFGGGAGIGGVLLICEKYTVVAATTNGCRIRLPDSIRRDLTVETNELFVQNLNGITGKAYQDFLLVQYLGDYECKAAAGGSNNIAKFTLGKDATKQEYLDYVANTKKKP